MRHLPDILALQRALVKRFQNVPEPTGTIEEFLNNQNAGTRTISTSSLLSGKCCLRQQCAGKCLVRMHDGFFMSFMCAVGLKVWYMKHIKIFLTTWNQLRVSLATNGKYQPL